MNGGAGQTRRRFFVIFQMLSWMFLPTARQKLPLRQRAGKSSTGSGAVVQHRLACPREEIVAPENAVVTPTNATRTHACAEHASDPSPLVAILHSTIATRQFFPNHLFDVIGFFESVSREARVFESRINFFGSARLICLTHAFNA
ncbi:hypothetical protein [Bradyrhizobium sp. 27S5]|uniref:hypothetical protein n=1 Tax=Bradyrhizobium sp. 27S5 TaxID=3139728 RepID=UPI0030D36154